VLEQSDPDRTIMINAGNCANYNSLLAETEFEYVVAAMGYSKFDLIGFGAWDAKLGMQIVRKVADKSVTDFVCANVEGFVPFLRLNKDSGKINVLVTSVIDPLLLEAFKAKGVTASDPVQAVNSIKRKIKHDIFILIVHAQGERIHDIIAGCAKDADLIIDGETGRVESKTRIVVGKPVVCNNFGGRHISYIDIVKAGQGQGFHVDQPVVARVVAKKVDPDPQMQSLVAKYDAERDRILKAEKERREREMMKNRKPVNMYLGSNWCGSCHHSIVENWQKTDHATAIEILKKKKKIHDPECLVCHVTGMGNKNAVGGFVSMETNAQMANVQCEVCHGPGGRHAQSPEKVKMMPVTEQGCRSCHNHDTDPDFSYQKDLLIINHGKDSQKNGK